MAKWKKPPLVEAEWWDAWSDPEKNGTVAAVMADNAYLLKRFTVGYLIGQTELVVVLAHDFDPPVVDDDSPTVAHLTVIPAGWVKRIKVIGGKGKHGKPQPISKKGTGEGAAKAGPSGAGDQRVPAGPEGAVAGEQTERSNSNSEGKEDH